MINKRQFRMSNEIIKGFNLDLLFTILYLFLFDFYLEPLNKISFIKIY